MKQWNANIFEALIIVSSSFSFFTIHQIMSSLFLDFLHFDTAYQHKKAISMPVIMRCSVDDNV
jgi:hypothetical protein